MLHRFLIRSGRALLAMALWFAVEGQGSSPSVAFETDLLEPGNSLEDKVYFWEPKRRSGESPKDFYSRIRKLADRDDPAGLASLAWCYMAGHGCTSDPKKGGIFYEKAAHLGHAGAQYSLGLLCEMGRGAVGPDPQTALQWHTKAAEGGLAEAQFRVGAYHASGMGTDKDLEKAADWYRRAAAQGEPRAHHNLGLAYLLAQGVPKDVTLAEKHLRAAWDAGLKDAAVGIGYALIMQKKEAEALPWVIRAAEGGNTAAEFLYAFHLLWTRNSNAGEQDLIAGVQYASRAAAKGNASAQGLLAHAYLAGKGIARDQAEGVRLAQLSASRGDKFGQWLLADLYMTGHGVPLDLAKAARLLQSSAEQGQPFAAFQLGLLFENGRGVARDFATAAKWYRAAAETQHAAAQYRLGLLYRDGAGVETNLNEALRLFRLAAASKLPEVAHVLGDLERQIAKQKEQSAAVDYKRCLELYKTGDEGLQEAVALCRKAADADYAPAQFFLSFLISNSQAGGDAKEARQWLQRAAEQDDIAAQAALAETYRKSSGPFQDRAQADVWTRKAALKATPEINYRLGLGLYRPSERSANQEDAKQALEFFRKAALAGHVHGQHALGYMLMKGTVGTPDLVEAYQWLSLAAARKHPEAEQQMKLLIPQLTAEQIAEGNARVEAFRATKQKAEADQVASRNRKPQSAPPDLAESRPVGR